MVNKETEPKRCAIKPSKIIPNPTSVGSNLPGTPSFLDTAFDPANFLNTETYGQVPANTTLTIKYSYGGGGGGNVTANISIISK